jgi:uncharacterized protein YdaU (DUF1376 family)
MIKSLKGFDIQKLYEKTGKRKYKMNFILDSFWIEQNENYQKLYKELSERMENAIIKLGDSEIKTSEYYQLEERRKNLIRDECFDLKWQIEHNNNDYVLEKYYLIEVDDEDCSNNDLLD